METVCLICFVFNFGGHKLSFCMLSLSTEGNAHYHQFTYNASHSEFLGESNIAHGKTFCSLIKINEDW